MKNKARKILVWCKETPFHLECKMGERIRNKIITNYSKPTTLPSRVRCPDCNKRFNPRIRECGDHNCWHIYIPAHKKYQKVK